MGSHVDDLAAIVGAPVEFTYRGIRISLKPIDWGILGELMQRLILRRLRAVPTADDVKGIIDQAIASDNPIMAKAIVDQVLSSISKAKAEASNPTYDDVIQWIAGDPNGVVEAVSCCAGDAEPNLILRMIGEASRSEDNEARRAMQRWMQVSGILAADNSEETGAGAEKK